MYSTCTVAGKSIWWTYGVVLSCVFISDVIDTEGTHFERDLWKKLILLLSATLPPGASLIKWSGACVCVCV